MRTSCLPHKLMCVMLRFFAAAVLALLTLKSPVLPAIVIDPDDARPVSPLLYGSQVHWPRQGNGVLVAPYHKLRLPVTFNSFFLEKAREMPLRTLRFHGDNVYNWRYGVGPHHLRPGCNFSQFGSAIWANDFGTHEFVTLCRTIGAEPVVVAPYLVARRQHERAPIATQMAANWVEYCNAPSPGLAYGLAQGWEPTTFTNSTEGLSDWEPGRRYAEGDRVRRHGAAFRCLQAHESSYRTEPGGGAYSNWLPYWVWLEPEEIAVPGKSWRADEKAPRGYFAWLRELFGHPAPFGIRYWEIGNEEWAWGGPDGCSWGRPEQYATNALAIIRAMKAVDPTIKCGINLPGPLDPNRRHYQTVVCGTPGNYTETYHASDFLVWHIYIGTNIPNTEDPLSEYLYQFKSVDRCESAHIELMRDYPKPVFITEFNVNYGFSKGADPNDQVHLHRLKSALIFACMFNHFARVGVSAVHQILFGEVGAWYESRLFRMVYDDIDESTGQQRQGVTPTYLVMKLYSTYGIGEVLRTRVVNEEGIHAQCFRDRISRRVRLFVVNQSASEAKSVTIDFGRLRFSGPLLVRTVTSDHGMEASNEQFPGSITIREAVGAQVTSSVFTHTFYPHSLTVLDLEDIEQSGSLSVNIAREPNDSSAHPSEDIQLTVTVSNNGDEVVASAEVGAPIPPGVEYVEGSSRPSADYDGVLRALKWRVENVYPGERRQLRFTVRVR